MPFDNSPKVDFVTESSQLRVGNRIFEAGPCIERNIYSEDWLSGGSLTRLNDRGLGAFRHETVFCLGALLGEAGHGGSLLQLGTFNDVSGLVGCTVGEGDC